jgi:hypothetical protein
VLQLRKDLQALHQSYTARMDRIAFLESTCRVLREKHFAIRGTFRTIVRIRGPPAPDQDSPRFKVTWEEGEDQQRLTIYKARPHSDPSGRVRPNTTETTFPLDHIFGPDTTDEQVYVEARPFLESAHDGAHVAIVAYGRSNTGKSTTIRGLLRHVGRTMFGGFPISDSDSDSLLSLSYTELYQETLYDLLPTRRTLDKAKGTRKLVAPVSIGATKVPIRDMSELNDVFARADVRRTTTATDINAHSSRSHAFVTLFMPKRRNNAGGSITFVDLAGHESQKKSGGDAGEATAINAGLSALNTSLLKLVEQKQQQQQQHKTSKKRGQATEPSAESIWCGSKLLLPRIIGGILTSVGAGGNEGDGERGKVLQSKVCLLGTVDLRQESTLQASITTLHELTSAAGIKSA